MSFEQVGDEEKKYQTMVQEWQSITSRQIDRWQDSLKVMTAKYNCLVNKARWIEGPSDTLSIINRARHETYHSAMIAWLCNPKRPHSLGKSFYLNLFSPDRHEVFRSLPDAHFISATCEEFTRLARADIVLEFDTCRIVIENKVDAVEQPEQCDRLLKGFRTSDRPMILVFLTPDRRCPTTLKIKTDWFIRLSYHDIINVLSECVAGALHPQAAGLTTACGYLQTLRSEFP